MLVVQSPIIQQSAKLLAFPPEGRIEDGVLKSPQLQEALRDVLRNLWAEVLHDEASSFSDEDIFFEVGGDSIRAQQLIAAAKRQGLSLTMDGIFMNASLSEMADVVQLMAPYDTDELEETHMMEPFSLLKTTDQQLQDLLLDVASEAHVSPHRIENAYPCSPMQESLISESEDAANLYVRQFVFRLRPGAALDRLRQAWDDTISANPVLRTRICHAGASSPGYTQVVVDERFEWATETTSLIGFLRADMRRNMVIGSQFFRYAVVTDQDEQGREERYLVWTAHHALCDGATIPEILDEVARRSEGAVVPYRQPFESFIKSAVLDTDAGDEEQFWKKLFENHSPTPYPSVSQIPEFQPSPEALYHCSLKIDQTRLMGLTNALLLRATWAILLSRYTGTEDVVFGTINNGRSAAISGVDKMLGPTISLVPVSLHVDPQDTIASFFSAVRVQSAELMRFEHSGVSKMRKHLASGGPSTVMDFQTLLVVHPRRFEDAIAPSMQALGLEYMDALGKKEEHPYPLVLTCTIVNETDVALTAQYDERVMAASQVENLGHQFQALLDQLTQVSPEDPLESLSPLSEHDVAQIAEWNRCTPQTEQVCVHELFQRQARKQPHATAVCTLEESLTYGEVDESSASIAAQLIEKGVVPGQFIAVCFEKSIWTVVAILAVLRAGAVYVPIEPDHPKSRITEVITTTNIKMALASTHGASVLGSLCDEIIIVNEKPMRNVRELPAVSPSSTAYLLFTSGSTGKPKGILMPHSGICTSIVNHGAAFGASPHWRTLQFGAHTFDLSIGEFFTTLAFGGCICVPSQEDRLNDLAGAITALKANTLLVVPTVANLLFPKDVPTLKTIVLAGEPITKETIVRWAAHVNLTAAYGPSETAVYCSGNVNVSVDAHPAHIGPAIGGTMWIANPDNYHELTAIGCVGEIVISGGLLGGGYFGDKAITDAAFVPAPEWMKKLNSNSTFDMLYRSGDLARYNADGTFHIVGRKDTQVKLRGYRIELGEIENQIMASGIVATAISALPARGPCAKQIVAVLSFNQSVLEASSSSGIVPSRDRHSPQTVGMLDRLRGKLALILPEYMVPTVWIVLEGMPLLISGKVDRKAVKQWIDAMDYPSFRELVEGPPQIQLADTGILPGSLAYTLRQLWSDVLNVPTDQLGLHTSFFAVGGDSIAAIQLVAKAKRLGIPVTVRGIIGAKTLGNLVTLVEMSHSRAKPDASKAVLLPDHKRPSTAEILRPYQALLKKKLRGDASATVVDAYYFSPFQREILKQRNANSAVFLLSWQMEIASRTSQPISLSALARAWERVVQKFPILRSVFLTDAAGKLQPIQVVLANARPEIATFCFPSGQTEPTFEMVGVPSVDECFLPHRALFSQSGGRFFIHIELDHLVIDGWSLKLIKTALLSAYEAQDIYVLEDAPTYKSFVEAHRPDRIEQDQSYWTYILQDQPSSILSLPPSPTLSRQPLSQRKTVFYLPDIAAAALTEFGAAMGLTPASIFDAAWAQTLSAFTHSSNVGFEYVVSGRDEDVSGVFDIVGPLINVLAYHLQDVSAAAGVDELARLARRMQDQRAQDSLHSSINIREVADAVKGEPLFNTAVNFQRRPTAVETETLWVDDDIKKSIDPWHFDVLVRVMHITDDNALRPSFEFDARRFDSHQMTKVAEDFWLRVQQIVRR